MSDEKREAYLAGWHDGREAAATKAENNGFFPIEGRSIAGLIRAIPEPKQEDER